MIFFLIICYLALALASDIRTRKIPNRLTFPAAAAGLSINAYQYGWDGCIASALGLALGLAFLLIPYLMGGIGAGDVKMLGALGALAGPKIISYGFAFGAILGGIIAVIIIFLRRFGIHDIRSIKQSFLSLLLLRSKALMDSHEERESPGTLPYSLPLAGGALVALLFNERLPGIEMWWGP